jgi:hypothetical protein
MAERAKAVVVDSDTIAHWLFQSEWRPMAEFGELPPNLVKYATFSQVPDLYFTARFHRDRQESDVRARWFDEAQQVLYKFFRESVFVLFPTDWMSKRWVDLACDDALPERVNREHLWIVAAAEQIRDSRADVTILSEEPDIYLSLRNFGLLNEVSVATRDEQGELDLWS